ncbi:thiol peroxidase [Desulfovibrio litoralis]|uniref:Thiol peroxidase n=1 Tax=Desulfovibrio litoralis DSM 11393 TaxID=1121455 RepID=A0A1M7SH01_9BACT|nr:thiol peroxidase [Desulfovibrio litoralis]SHN57753.1 thiol peroxidase (atypical 2-Cys peroxiredoxin) [Desulfovibrio litoralis DSM 11393]
MERSGLITFQGNPLTLVGNSVKLGEKAPDFTVLANDLSPRTLDSYKGKVLIISSVPSLDTSVCDTATRQFNKDAACLSDDIKILTISVDLPFAQARWCGAAGIDKVVTLSDHKDLSFGTNYGMAIKELRLLARGVFVVDRNQKLVYTELVNEVTDQVNFNAALEAAKKALA